MEKCHIYELFDPVRGVVFYVGRTAGALDVRLRFHVDECLNRADKRVWRLKNIWVQDLMDSYGALPVIRRIETVCNCENQAGVFIPEMRESFWMIQRLLDDCPLVNVSCPMCDFWGIPRSAHKRMARQNLVRWCRRQPVSPVTKWVIDRWGGRYE